MSEIAAHPVTSRQSPAAATLPWSMRWQVPLFLAALAAWGIFLWVEARGTSGGDTPESAEARIRAAFDRHDFERAGRDADILLARYPSYPRQAEVQLLSARAAFELGESEAARPERSRAAFGRSCVAARRALLGLAEDRTTEAFELLVRSYERLGDDRGALDVLRELRRSDSAAATRLALVQAEAEFRLGEVDAGRATAQGVLAVPGLTDDRQVAALLALADGLRRNGRLDEAEPHYRRIIGVYPKSARVKDVHFGMGLLLRARSAGNAALLDLAMRRFNEVLAMRNVANEALDRKAAFYVGECLYEKQEFESAADTFRRVSASWPGTPEGIASALRLASVHVTRERFEAARDALDSALAQADADRQFDNPYVTPAEVNATWLAVLRHFLSKGESDTLEAMTRDSRRLARREVYLVQQAGLFRQHARALADESAALRRAGKSEEAAAKEQESRFTFRRAADLLVKIVHGVEGDAAVYRTALLTAADSLREGGAFAEAAVYYRLLLADADARGDAPTVRLQYARALQAMGRHAEAKVQLDLCIDEFRSDPRAADALLANAESFRALGAWDNAAAAYGAIVHRPDLVPPSGRIGRRALSEFGYALYRAGKYREAVERLDETLERPGALDDGRLTRVEAAYYLADAWRSIGSTDPAARRGELSAAAKRFADTREEEATAPGDAALQRRSLCAEAACRYELGDFRAALALYREAAEKYLDTVDGVGALYAAAACLGRLGERDAADRMLARARWSHAKLRREHAGELTAFVEDSWNAMTAWQVAGGTE